MNELIKTTGIKKDNILHGIDFSMESGEMVAIMGPSGSGKSTLMYMLSGMDDVSEGKIFFRGKEITNYEEEERAKLRLHEMGFVFQQMNMLPNLNIIDNIILPAIECQKHIERKDRITQEDIKSKAENLMKKVGISGLENRKISEVSGGQLQRACICRALMNEPFLLFADEPTGALNRAAAEEVMDEFLRLNREGMSILLVTHDIKVASACRRVLYLVDGKLVGEYIRDKDLGEDRDRNEKQLNQWLSKYNITGGKS